MDQADPVHPQDRLVSIYLAQVVGGKTSCHGIGMGLEFPANQVMFKARVSHFQGNIQVIAKHGDPGVTTNVADHLGSGRATVDEHNIAILNERSSHYTYDAFLFR